MINRRTKVKLSCKNELRIETKRLKVLLKFYGEKDSLAVICLNELNPIMDEILKGNTDKPYDQIPCARYFIDATLSEYQDLSQCYSKFANLAEGVDRNEIDDFLNSL